MKNRGASSAVGSILLIGVTISFMSLMGYYLIDSVDVSEKPDARINIDESYDSIVFTVERNENVDIISVLNEDRKIIGSEPGDSLELQKKSGEYLVIGYIDDNTNEVIKRHYVGEDLNPREDITWVNKNSYNDDVVVSTKYYNPHNNKREQKVNLSVADFGIVDSENIEVKPENTISSTLVWNISEYNIDNGNYKLSVISNDSRVSREIEVNLFDATDGFSVINEVEKNGINNGRCDVDKNVCQDTYSFKPSEDKDGFGYIENKNSITAGLNGVGVGGSLIVNSASQVNGINMDGGYVGGDLILKAHGQNADVDVDLSSGGKISGDMIVDTDTDGSIDLDFDPQETTIEGDLIIRDKKGRDLSSSVVDSVEGDVIKKQEEIVESMSNPS